MALTDRQKYLRKTSSFYVAQISRGGRLSVKSQSKYRSVLVNCSDCLERAGFDASPKRVTEDAVLHLYELLRLNQSPSYARWQMAIFGAYLEHAGNKSVKNLKLAWPVDNRTHVDWLTPEETILLMDACRGSTEEMVVHLELRMGMRRIEVQRLTAKDIQPPTLHVHGKGRGGGKWRTLALAPDSRYVFSRYDLHRREMLEAARVHNPAAALPSDYLIYQRGQTLAPYGLTAIDYIVARVGERAGITRGISNHTLRRTWGRNAYYAGVPLVEISAAYGHSDLRQTMRYLGLRVDDLARAQDSMSRFLEDVRKRMKDADQSPSYRIEG